ncbi:hypothetical protein EON81_01270 [bacterium]|nr:MAG: hypothetical protein EON81_01270 [bacterium]
MNRIYWKSLGFLAFLACSATASAQFVYDPTCWPDGGPGFSDDYGAQVIPLDPNDDPLFGAAFGISGTDTFASPPSSVCLLGGSLAAPGRISFTVGPTGSIQSTQDDYLRLSFGAPFAALASTSYAIIRSRPVTPAGGAYTTELIGSDAAVFSFPGASDRYAIAIFNTTNYRVQLQLDVIGDVARVNWLLTNSAGADSVARETQLWFGHWVTLKASDSFESRGANFVTVPGRKPLVVGKRFQQTVLQPRVGESQPAPMVDTASFAYSQENAYGLRIFNTPSTDGSRPPDQTPVEELAIGIAAFLLNIPLSASVSTMNDFIFSDARFADYDNLDYNDTGFIQKFTPTVLAGGAAQNVVSYYGSTWSVANYNRPYTAVVDAPTLIQTTNSTAQALTPNPFTMRVYVDNTRGFSSIDKEFPLDLVEIKVTLPPGMVDDENPTRNTITKFINRVDARKMEFRDFRVRVSEEISGLQPYTVEINSQPNAKKLIQGEFNIASTPRLRLPTRTNLVTSPFRFASGSWETILGLQVDSDFRAFTWDPIQQEYVIQTGPQRGIGSWILTEQPSGASFELGGEPSQAPDTTTSTGAPTVVLQPGWNLIANPYNYAIPIGYIVGVNSGNNEEAFTFRELVDQGVISGALAYWDNDAPVPDYRYIQSDTDLLLPNRGYWIRVDSASSVPIRFSQVFTPFLQRQTSATLPKANWKLQLAARTSEALDGQNFVGVASNAAAAKALRIAEPPISPADKAVSLSIDEGGDKPQLMAQSLATSAARKEWTVRVQSKAAGPVTITWPNMSQVPNNVSFKLVDKATGASKLLRRTSGYTFTSEANSVRQFTLSMEPGTVARALIGSITATRTGRSTSSPLSINYSLTGDATTTVRVLSNGHEIYVATRARAEGAGERSVVWNLRDSANRAVAPGTYTVEITAESASGERVRRFLPVNIVR